MENIQQNMSTKALNFHDLNLHALKKRCGLTVRITSGAHSNAQLSFDLAHKQPIKIGCSQEDDIILLASKVVETHLTITPGSFADNSIIITAKNGPLTLDDGQVLDAAQWARVYLPTTIKFGDTSIYLERDIGIDRVKKVAEPILLLGGSIVIGALVTAVVASGFSHIKEAVANTKKNPAAIVAQAPLQAPLQNSQKQRQTTTLLRQKISQTGLSGYISVGNGLPGTVEISGIIPKKERVQWRTVLQWYDAQPDLAPIVNKVTTGKNQNLNFVIKSVWLDGDDRVVVFEGGQRAKIGETIKDGWRISSISENAVSMNRGTRTVKITY